MVRPRPITSWLATGTSRGHNEASGQFADDLPDLNLDAGNDKQGVIAGPYAQLSWVLLTSPADMSTKSLVRHTKEQDFVFSVRPP